MGMRSWDLKRKRNFLYLSVAVNTCFMLFGLFALSDLLLALISFSSCVICWVAILAFDREIELQNKDKKHYNIEREDEDD